MQKQINSAHIFILATLLGLAGFIAAYFLIHPYIYVWANFSVPSKNIQYMIYKLIVADAVLVPSLIAYGYSAVVAVKSKQHIWNVCNVLGSVLVLYMVVYFALPILYPVVPL